LGTVGSIVSHVDATSALADLTEISSQVQAAVVLEGHGAVLASTLAEQSARERLARTGAELLEAAGSAFGTDGRAVSRLEVALGEGSVFALEEGGLAIVARTSPNPSSGLVHYDLGTCLRAVAESRTKPKSRRRAPKRTQKTADA
jgi:predicted regulator of Ras-like GTPase activity (Roadblock/LC7/MglB family)